MIAGYKGPTFIPDNTCHKGWTVGLEGTVSTALCLTVLGKAGLLFPWPPSAFTLDVPFLSEFMLGFIVGWQIVSFLLPFDCVGFLEYCVENEGKVDKKQCCAHLARSPMGKGVWDSTILPQKVHFRREELLCPLFQNGTPRAALCDH